MVSAPFSPYRLRHYVRESGELIFDVLMCPAEVGIDGLRRYSSFNGSMPDPMVVVPPGAVTVTIS
jgi:hypothetical protein